MFGSSLLVLSLLLLLLLVLVSVLLPLVFSCFVIPFERHLARVFFGTLCYAMCFYVVLRRHLFFFFLSSFLCDILFADLFASCFVCDVLYTSFSFFLSFLPLSSSSPLRDIFFLPCLVVLWSRPPSRRFFSTLL